MMLFAALHLTTLPYLEYLETGKYRNFYDVLTNGHFVPLFLYLLKFLQYQDKIFVLE